MTVLRYQVFLARSEQTFGGHECLIYGWVGFIYYVHLANNNYLVFREILSPVVGQNSHSPSIVHECSTLAMVYLSFLSKIHDSNAMSGVR